MPNVYLLSDDLMTTSRIQGAAAGAGIDVVHAFDVDSLLRQVSAAPNEARPLIVVDLQARGVEWFQALRELTKLGRVLAFGPHVWKEQLDLARDAGCDHVLTNGEFYGRLGAWLASDG